MLEASKSGRPRHVTPLEEERQMPDVRMTPHLDEKNTPRSRIRQAGGSKGYPGFFKRAEEILEHL